MSGRQSAGGEFFNRKKINLSDAWNYINIIIVDMIGLYILKKSKH